ncbi:MAG: YicC/YloC family endoribonuclease [Thermodesulfobacteriota bacterium]
MLKSMTAFGRANGELPCGLLTIEMKSVNHRYLDISLRLPKKYTTLEERIRKKIAAQFSRGRIEIMLQVNGDATRVQNLELDTGLAAAYHKILGLLKEQFDLKGEIELSLMTSFKDLILIKEEAIDIEKDWEIIEPILAEGMSSMEKMRIEEGRALYADLIKRLDLLSSLVNDIQNRVPDAIKVSRDKLEERIKALLEDIDVDPMRLAQEVAIMADRSDVTEELVRIRSHFDQFRGLAHTDEAIGRKLDFLIQEMHREANTIGSKAGDAFISHKVVDIKSELEKMREQVQNVE